MAGIRNSWSRCPRCMRRRKAGQKLCKDCLAYEEKARRVRIHGFKGIRAEAAEMGSLADVDDWRFENPDVDESSRPCIMSRYSALCSLFGVPAADRIMREQEVASWDVPERRGHA